MQILYYFLYFLIFLLSLYELFYGSIFPLKTSTSEIIDCKSISVVSLIANEGKISIQVRIPEYFEYPKQDIFTFLSLNIQTSYFLNPNNHFYNQDFYYFDQNFSDVNFSDSKFTFESNFNSENGFFGSKMINSTDFIFNVYYQFYGHHHLNLKCVNSNIFKTELDFDKITHFLPNTTIVESPGKYKNICYGNKKFYAILPQTVIFPNIFVGDYSFPFYNLKKIRGYKYVFDSSYLFTNFRYQAWQQILFQLTPLLNFIQGGENSNKEVRLYSVTKNEKNVKMPSIFKSRILFYSDLHVCFQSLEILSEINKFNIELGQFQYGNKDTSDQTDYSDLINEALFEQNFTLTREVALKKPINPEKIAISADLRQFYHLIESEFPYIEIFEISENSTCSELASQLGDALILIGTKISELVGSVFLNENAVVVDLQGYRGFCSDWMKRFASNLRLKYIFYGEDCDCDDFSCSDLIDWDSQIRIDGDDFLAIIKELLGN